jgi:hypothetical protein
MLFHAKIMESLTRARRRQKNKKKNLDLILFFLFWGRPGHDHALPCNNHGATYESKTRVVQKIKKEFGFDFVFFLLGQTGTRPCMLFHATIMETTPSKTRVVQKIKKRIWI